MTLRARTGRENADLHDTTVAFIRSKKRNSFLLIKENNKPEELTFLQAEEIYRANTEEKSVPLTENHHTQVGKAIAFFKQQLEIEKQTERTVVISQSPAEKQALNYLEAIINLQLADNQEKELLILAKESINLGKFQKLSKEISKLHKSLKKITLSPAKQLETVMKIVKNYPLQKNEEKQETEEPKENEDFMPEIIISESFK